MTSNFSFKLVGINISDDNIIPHQETFLDNCQNMGKFQFLLHLHRIIHKLTCEEFDHTQSRSQAYVTGKNQLHTVTQGQSDQYIVSKTPRPEYVCPSFGEVKVVIDSARIDS